MSSSSWVLVTGANRGLGFATAEKLVNDGESVIVGARSQASGALLHHIPCLPTRKLHHQAAGLQGSYYTPLDRSRRCMYQAGTVGGGSSDCLHVCRNVRSSCLTRPRTLCSRRRGREARQGHRPPGAPRRPGRRHFRPQEHRGGGAHAGARLRRQAGRPHQQCGGALEHHVMPSCSLPVIGGWAAEPSVLALRPLGRQILSSADPSALALRH